MDNFEKIPPEDTFQMSQLKIAIGQKAFSLLFTFCEQIRYWGNSVGILSILVFLFILRVLVLRFHRNTEAVRHINICIINVALVESVSIQTCLNISCLILTSIPAISHLVCNQCLCVGN